MPIKPGKEPGTYRIWVQLPHRKQRECKRRCSYKDAQAIEARMLLERDAALRAGPGTPGQGTSTDSRQVQTFEHFCVTRYGPYGRRELRPSTWASRRYQIPMLCRTVIYPPRGGAPNGTTLGEILLPEFSPAVVEALKDARLRATYGPSKRPIKRTAINNDLRTLSAVLSYARRLADIAAPPKFPIPPLSTRGEKRRVRAWTTDEVNALFAAAHREALELVPMLAFLLNTGCRKGECIACEWSWVDIPRDGLAVLRIPANEVWSPKNDLPREVTISDALRAVLLGIKRAPTVHAKYVFVTRDGGRYAHFPTRWWHAARNAAGLTGGVHQTRHTFASHFLRATKDLPLLSRVLGQSLARVTEMYVHMLPGHLAESRNAVNIAPVVSVPEEVQSESKKTQA